MTRQKTEHFSDRQVDLAAFAKALSHPARIAIVTQLSESGPLMCKDIVSALPLSQATTSQHIQELVKAGLLVGEARGPAMFYRLERSHIRNFCKTFQETLRPATEDGPIECSL